MAQINQILLFTGIWLLAKSKITVWEGRFFKKKISIEILRLCLSYVKRLFKSTREVLFSLFLKFLRFCCVWECRFWRHQKPQLENDTFSRKSFYGGFEIVCTLSKKVFWIAPMKCFYLYGSNNSEPLAFEDSNFGVIKDDSLRTTTFQKKFLWEFWVCVYP